MRERALVPKRHQDGCMHEHLYPRQVHARGCCDSCYNRIMELIREGKTTDAECVALGMLLPKSKTMQQELEERRKALRVS